MREEPSVGRAPRRPGRWHRRLLTVAAALVVAAVGVVAPAPQPAQAAKADSNGVKAVTSKTADFAPGQSAWVSVVWKSTQTVTDWSTTVSAPAGVTVTYPTTRGGTDTSLSASDTLVGKVRDFTAFRLSVPYTQTSNFKITVTSTYRLTVEGAGTEQFTYSTEITVPVKAASGTAYAQKTSRLAMEAGSVGWAQLTFQAGKGDLGNFTVELGELPEGLTVTYPGDGTHAGLHRSSDLIGRTTDHVAIRLDATNLAKGNYRIPMTIRYQAATAQTAEGTVTLDVS